MAKISYHTQFETPGEVQVTSLPELLGAFSYALDLTEGQPAGHSLRAGWIAMQLCKALGIPTAERRIIYYATLLKDLGCSSNAARVAEIYLTDDRSFKHDYKLIGDGIGPALRFVLAKTGQGENIARRSKAILNILKNGPDLARSLIETRCTRGAEIARLLRFPEAVSQGIYSLDEHWDGSGKPAGLPGHAIPLASRIALLAQISDVFFTNAGPEAARAEVTRLSGIWLDPELAQAFTRISAARQFWAKLSDDDCNRDILRDLPDDGTINVDDDYLDAIAAAFG